MTARYWAVILAIGAVFGTTFILNALLLPHMSAGWISAGRLAIAAAVCWIVALAFGKRPTFRFGLWLKLGGFGTIAYGIPFALFPLAQQNISSGTAGTINALTPVMTAVVSAIWVGGERISWLKGLGVVAGFLGAASLSFGALGNGESEVWAILLAVTATILYAVAFNLARSFRHIDPALVSAIALTGGAIGVLPVALVGGGFPTQLSGQAWMALLSLGVFPTALTAILMYQLLPRIGPLNFSLNTFITPVIAVLLGMVFLGERIEPMQGVGIAFIMLGLLLIDGRAFSRFRPNGAS